MRLFFLISCNVFFCFVFFSYEIGHFFFLKNCPQKIWFHFFFFEVQVFGIITLTLRLVLLEETCLFFFNEERCVGFNAALVLFPWSWRLE